MSRRHRSSPSTHLNNVGFVYASYTNDDGRYKIEGDMVVHGADRAPEIDDLELGAGGIERENNILRKMVKVKS